MAKELAFKTKADLVYENVRARVLSGELPPGARLPINKIAAELGISGIPVREGLKRLEAQGLLTLHAHKGAVVTEFSIETIRGLFLIRGQLEGLAISEAAPRLTDEILLQLRGLLDQMYEAERIGNSERASRLHHEFHMVIYRAQPHLLLLNMIVEFWEMSDWATRVYAAKELDVATAAEHEGIYDALVKRKGSKAAKIHIDQKTRAAAWFVEHAQQLDS